MYSITWVTPFGIETISSPRFSAALRVYIALKYQGNMVRMWHNGKTLVM